VTGLPPPLVAITGAWLDPPVPEPLAPAIESFLAEGPALLATFGTMPDVTGRTAALIAAAEKSGWRALIQVLPPARAPAPVPPGIAIVCDRLPFAALLPRVAAVVHHGSVGTLHEVLRAGRPSFVIPHMGDQSFWAATLCRHGLGPAPVPSTALDPELVAARLIELRDSACALRAREFGARIAAEDGVAFAAGRLEALAEARA
jgi:sterol 3beta-glucosyltransferase